MPSSPQPQRDDRALLADVRLGDAHAAAVLVERLAPIVNRMVFRLTGWHNDTQDIVQSVFLEIQQSSKSFRGDAKLETWVTSITIHCCRQWLRRRSLPAQSANTIGFEPLDDSFQQSQQSAEISEEVRLALKQLSHTNRELLVLRYLEGISLDEIAQLLGIRKNALEVRLHRARKELAALLAARTT